jgi:centrosomal protein CEP290
LFAKDYIYEKLKQKGKFFNSFYGSRQNIIAEYVGKLHRHIVALQVSEGTAVRKLEEATKKIHKLEALILRASQKIDEKEETIFHGRQEGNGKIRHLKRTVQDLRRKYTGAIPLQQQEKFADQMVRLQEASRRWKLN